MRVSFRDCSLRAGKALALFSTLAVAACAAGTPGTKSASQTSARVFAVGLADVQRVYIDDVEIDDIALAGVEGLLEIDPEISIERRGQNVQLAFKGETTGSYSAPGDHDPGGWGRLTDSLVRDLASVSPALANAGSERIYETIFDAVADSLDKYSRYASRSEAQENRANRDGFGGVGIRIDVVPEGVAVQSVMRNTPAERAGLKAGDIIVAIDGVSAEGIDSKNAVKRLRGPLDSEVLLTVERGEDGTLAITVVRDFIVPQTVTWEVRDEVLILRVEGFNHDTTRALQAAAIEARTKTSDPFAGVVLDLRGNPGGLLDQSVSVSDLFLDEGTIVTTHGRHPESHQVFKAERSSVLRELPIVVLINGYSASASEIVAAALQDNGRALVAGSVSYGKGSVQTLLRLPNQGELTLTWARFHAPSGYPLSGRGVMPNVCTSGIAAASEALLAARRQSRSTDDRTRVVNHKDEAALASFRSRCPSQREESDLDLQVAVQLIKDGRLYRQLIDQDLALLAN